jgi:hypothetical protein
LADSSLQPIRRGSARGLQRIAAVLIAICFASTGEAATLLEPPGAAKKVTVQPRGRAYLFRGFIGLTDWGMDELTDRINRTGSPQTSTPT